MIRTVIIVATGEELLYGTTADTNSSYISSRFFGTNFHVIRHISVGDNITDIENAVRDALNLADIVITTGGLGPTDDDNTVGAVCRIFSVEPAEDSPGRDRMVEFFESMEMEIRKEDFRMISVPETSHVIKNNKGLAPGFLIENNDKILISMPGVPAEMTAMFDGELLPFLEKKFGLTENQKLAYKVSGIRESEVNRLVGELGLPENIRWGITAKTGVNDLTFLSDSEIFKERECLDRSVRTVFADYLIDSDFSSPEEELIFLLGRRGFTVSTAESCTGGLIGKTITDVPGSSDVYYGSVVAYSNHIKSEILGVSEASLGDFGAVSETVAAEMAEGIRKKFNSTIGISTTGIAGPGGGSIEKPVGTVCFGFSINGEIKTFTKFINGSRGRVRAFSALYAINYLRKLIKET